MAEEQIGSKRQKGLTLWQVGGSDKAEQSKRERKICFTASMRHEVHSTRSQTLLGQSSHSLEKSARRRNHPLCREEESVIRERSARGFSTELEPRRGKNCCNFSAPIKHSVRSQEESRVCLARIWRIEQAASGGSDGQTGTICETFVTLCLKYCISERKIED